jgi:hypothetical protein
LLIMEASMARNLLLANDSRLCDVSAHGCKQGLSTIQLPRGKPVYMGSLKGKKKENNKQAVERGGEGGSEEA